MSVQPQESASRAGRLDRILRELLHQTPGVEAAAVVSFDGLPMASALPADMDEDRVAAMSAALLSLAERAAQGLGRGDLSQVYIEGEHGTVFLVSAQDEGVLIAVTAAGAKVGMMLYEVKLAANRVGEVLHGPAPLPAPLPPNLTRDYLDEHTVPAAGPLDAPTEEPVAATPATVAEVAASYSSYSEPTYSEQSYSEPVYTEQAPVETYAGYYTQPAGSAAPAAASSEEVEPAPEPASWSSYAPSGSVLPSERSSWS
jgi:predicted regulator of Ras-like GTPase activity (Roadblock/LC7/MglB family)